MTNHTPNDHSNTKKLSLKERFVKYLVENAEIFNSATAAIFSHLFFLFSLLGLGTHHEEPQRADDESVNQNHQNDAPGTTAVISCRLL